MAMRIANQEDPKAPSPPATDNPEFVDLGQLGDVVGMDRQRQDLSERKKHLGPLENQKEKRRAGRSLLLNLRLEERWRRWWRRMTCGR